jgi:hypothetical protein
MSAVSLDIETILNYTSRKASEKDWIRNWYTSNMIADVVSNVFFFTAVIVPVLFVIKWLNWKGLLAATFVVYFLLIAEELITPLFGAIPMEYDLIIWITIGIPVSLIYVLIVALVYTIYRDLKKIFIRSASKSGKRK